MSTDSLPRATIDTDEEPGRFRRAWDTLQDTLRQPVQTVTRSATLKTVRTGVEDVDSPDAIPDYVELYYDTGAIRKNLNEFRDDVTEPGLRVEVDEEENENPEATQDYFMGGDAAPEGAPENGFLSECFVFDEKRQPIERALDLSVLDRWRRGTVLLVNVYGDREGEDGPIISGCTFVRPETMSARTYAGTNQLLLPDPDAGANASIDPKLTDREEVAAWVQFDEQSITHRLFKRSDGNRGQDLSNETSVYLSQNDVHKLTLDQDVGGDDPEEGVFGESAIRSISEEADSLNDIKRDLEKGVEGAALGFYTLEANDYVIDAGDEKILVEWPDEDIDSLINDLDELEPGSVIGTDAKAALERVAPNVPDVEWILSKYTRDIVDPLPAPFYKHSDAVDLNRDIGKDQQEDYQDRISTERNLQAQFWEGFLRQVADRHPDLDPTGLSVSIEPEQDDSPVMSLDNETIERISTLSGAIRDLYGPGGAPSFIREQILNELILQLPQDATVEGAEVDELGLDVDPETEAEFRRLMDGD